MTDADLWAAWRLWLMLAVAIILVAAALLITIWLTARSILAHAVGDSSKNRSRNRSRSALTRLNALERATARQRH